MVSKSKWNTGMPKEPGWYWWREMEGDVAQVIEIERSKQRTRSVAWSKTAGSLIAWQAGVGLPVPAEMLAAGEWQRVVDPVD